MELRAAMPTHKRTMITVAQKCVCVCVCVRARVRGTSAGREEQQNVLLPGT